MSRKIEVPPMGALVHVPASNVVGTVQGRGLVQGEPGALVCAEGEQPQWRAAAELVVLAGAAA